MLRDLKYLLAYVIPLSGFIAIHSSGWMTWFTVIVAFMIIPILEVFFSISEKNYTAEEEGSRLSNALFDVMLYLNIPLLFALIFMYLTRVTDGVFTNLELLGSTLSVGIVLGTFLNVAHELMHKPKWYEQLASKIILTPILYLHFIIEHNRGHHLNVATPLDPATSKKDELIYTFWLRSIVLSYLHAWTLEQERLSKLGKRWLSKSNEMIVFSIVQLLYLLLVYYLFSKIGVLFAIAVAIIGILLLETINYIEHYGLQRKKLENGKYERVDVIHSWNSSHQIGRIVLYELTRHSDHHYKANRKYQILRHYKESPQLPFGHPTSMLIAFVPPLWFRIMNPKLKAQLIKNR